MCAGKQRRRPNEKNENYATTIECIKLLIQVCNETLKDDTKIALLEKIQRGLGRNDISIDNFSEHPEKSLVCVPPVSKPEGVTDDEMIDFIVKNTLWKANDLIKKEKESPGYIDKLYIDKLRGAEIDRVRGS